MGIGIFALCMSLGVAVQTGMIRVSAQNAEPFNGPVITEETPLFNFDGTYNADLVAELVYLAQNAGRGAPNLHANHHGVTGITVSDANDIRTANDGALPDIRLFEPHGTFSATGMPSHGDTNDQSRDNFTHSRWRLVYITHPNGGGDPVFTFRMIEAFRNNALHSTTDNWVADVRYEHSDIRLNLTQEFNNVLDLFVDPAQMRNHFVEPGNLPGAWQNAQPDVGNPVNQALETQARNDLIWIPSAYEVAGSSNQDLWRLTSTERSHVQNGFSAWSWLRSGQLDAQGSARRIEALGTAMRNDVNTVTTGQAIVPGIHLSLSHLLNYANIGVEFSDVSSRAATSSESRLTIERNTGVETITFNAGLHNTIQTLTIGTGANQFILTPTDAPTVTENALGRFEIYYTNNGQIVHLELSEVLQGFNIVASTTNNWEITRRYNWPTGFGLATSPANSIIVANNTFAIATADPVAQNTPNGHRFNGWWTQDGTGGNWGEQITYSTLVANRSNTEEVAVITTLYARWLQNTATIIRVNYDGSTENVGEQTVWLSGAVGYPTVEPTDETLVFGGWWTQDGTGGNWGQRVNANTFITEAQNGTTIEIFARWQVYVSRPVLSALNLTQGSISWMPISGATFIVSINGVDRAPQSGASFDFSDFAAGEDYTISIVTVAGDGSQSDAFTITISIPEDIHIPTFTEDWAGYEGARPTIGDTRTIGEYEYELVRWDTVVNTELNGDTTIIHTARWERIEEPVHIPTFTEDWIGYNAADFGGNRPIIGDTRTIGEYEYELVRWDTVVNTELNGDTTIIHTARWERIEEPVHIPTFTEDWVGYNAADFGGNRPIIGDTRIIGEYEYELVRWNTASYTAANGNVTVTHTAVWERVEESIHIPTFTETFAGYNPADFGGNRPTIGQTRVDGEYEYELVRWNTVSDIALNGDVAVTHTAVWEIVVATPHIPTVTEVWTGYQGTRPELNDTRTIGDNEYILTRWDTVTTTASNGNVTITHTAFWTEVTQRTDSNFITDILPWILIAGAGLLVLTSIVFFAIAARKGSKSAARAVK